MNYREMFLLTFFVLFTCQSAAAGQESDQVKLAALEQRINALEEKSRSVGDNEYLDSGLEENFSLLEMFRERLDTTRTLILFLYGTFCALWAQNTGRSPWLWFFLGLFFSIITVLFLLGKNSNRKKGSLLLE